MGTRGFTGVLIEGQEKIGYQQYDSRPNGAGLKVLKSLRLLMRDEEQLRKQARDLNVVDASRPPLPSEVKRLKPYTDLGVGAQSTDDWYCLLRNTQGNLDMILECGYIDDSASFALDSLFCEWGYLVDLDQGTFEVYKGFQEERPREGRWAGRPTLEEVNVENNSHDQDLADGKINETQHTLFTNREYYAVNRVASWPLNSLPSDEEFLAVDRER